MVDWLSDIWENMTVFVIITKQELNFYVHVTVHSDKFPYNKTNQMH
jgi:hypothetical protein